MPRPALLCAHLTPSWSPFLPSTCFMYKSLSFLYNIVLFSPVLSLELFPVESYCTQLRASHACSYTTLNPCPVLSIRILGLPLSEKVIGDSTERRELLMTTLTQMSICSTTSSSSFSSSSSSSQPYSPAAFWPRSFRYMIAFICTIWFVLYCAVFQLCHRAALSIFFFFVLLLK